MHSFDHYHHLEAEESPWGQGTLWLLSTRERTLASKSIVLTMAITKRQNLHGNWGLHGHFLQEKGHWQVKA